MNALTPCDIASQQGWFNTPTCSRHTLRFIAVVAALLAVTPVVVAAEKSGKRDAPKASDLQAFAFKVLDGTPGFDRDGVISRGQATHVMSQLMAKGWKIDNAKEVLERTLPDNDFLIRQLSDEAGKVFLKKIGDVEGSLDRLDRLARMPQGENNVNDLIRKVPNGYEWITSMSNTAHGRRMAERLEAAQGGQDFNEPTGRIYTVKALSSALEGHVTRNEARN